MPPRRGALTLLRSAARAVVAPPRRFHLASSSSSLAAGRAGDDVVANATAASPPMPTPMDDVRREKHARVSIPRALPPLSARPFAETISPCAPGDAAAVLRQSKKRRGYPIACAARCRHGRYRAFLHAPMHVPAATADGSIDGVGVGGDGDGDAAATKAPSRAELSKMTRRQRARALAASPTRGAVAEHATSWLCCPLLAMHVDALEARGGIDAMAKVVANVPALSRALEDAHSGAVATRRWLLPRAWEKRIKMENHAGGAFERHARVLFDTGLVGVSVDADRRGWSGNRVKCLHAHVGDALVRGESENVVGALTLARLRESGVDVDGDDACFETCDRGGERLPRGPRPRAKTTTTTTTREAETRGDGLVDAR